MGLTPDSGNGVTTQEVQEAGGIVIELMVDANPADATVLVDAWITSDGRDLNCSVVHDKDGMSNGALDGPQGNREYGYVIDLSTMEILWRGFGSLGSQPEASSSAVQGLVEMCSRLGC